MQSFKEVPLQSQRPLASTVGNTTYFSPEFQLAPRALRALIYAHENAHLRQRRSRITKLPKTLSGHPIYRQMLELDASIGSLALLAGREPAFMLPDDPAVTAHWGPSGHYWTALCVMLTAGMPLLTARRRAFFCQMPDQVLEFDAIAAAVDFTTVSGVSPAQPFLRPPATPPDERGSAELVVSPGYSVEVASGVSYPVFPRIATPLPWESDYSIAQRRLRARQISTGLHCLTGRRGSDEVAFRAANARQYVRDEVRFGLALHCFGDSYSHQVEQAQYDAWQRNVRVAEAVGVVPGLAARAVPMPPPGYMYPPITGHGPAGHAPDDLREHQSQYLAYVGALYDLVTGALGGGSQAGRAGLIAGLRHISGVTFHGNDKAINAQQSAAIRGFCYRSGLAAAGSLDSYLPEGEDARYWRNFHPIHMGMMRPEGADEIFRIAREVGAAWSMN